MVEIICDPKNARRGMSNNVRRKMIFCARTVLASHAETIKIVRRYTKTILLNSKTSEVYGQRISGTKKNKIAKRINIVFCNLAIEELYHQNTPPIYLLR